MNLTSFEGKNDQHELSKKVIPSFQSQLLRCEKTEEFLDFCDLVRNSKAVFHFALFGRFFQHCPLPEKGFFGFALGCFL